MTLLQSSLRDVQFPPYNPLKRDIELNIPIICSIYRETPFIKIYFEKRATVTYAS